MVGKRWAGVVVAVALVAVAGCTSHAATPVATGRTPASSPSASVSPLEGRLLTAGRLPGSLSGWRVGSPSDDGAVVLVPQVSCSSLLTDVTWLGVRATARADVGFYPPGGDLNKWHGDETIARYAGNAAQAMAAIRHIASMCAADPSPGGDGVNAVVTAGPTWGDECLELTAHVNGDDTFLAADTVVIRSGQDMLVVRQDVLDYGKLDPATTRLVATAAWDAYRHQA